MTIGQLEKIFLRKSIFKTPVKIQNMVVMVKKDFKLINLSSPDEVVEHLNFTTLIGFE